MVRSPAARGRGRVRSLRRGVDDEVRELERVVSVQKAQIKALEAQLRDAKVCVYTHCHILK